VDSFVASQLAFDDLHVDGLEVAPVAGGEVVEHPHLVAALEQRADEVRADEAGTAGDEDARHYDAPLLLNVLNLVAARPNASQVSASSGIPAT
jgi:hypothetical protein